VLLAAIALPTSCSDDETEEASGERVVLDGLIAPPDTEPLGDALPVAGEGGTVSRWRAVLLVEGEPIAAFNEAVRQAEDLGFTMGSEGESPCVRLWNEDGGEEHPLSDEVPPGTRVLWDQCDALGTDGSTTLQIRLRHRVPEGDLRWISHLLITQRPGTSGSGIAGPATAEEPELAVARPDTEAPAPGQDLFAFPTVEVRPDDRVLALPSLTGEAPGCRGGLEALIAVAGPLDEAAAHYQGQLAEHGFTGEIIPTAGMGSSGLFAHGSIPGDGGEASIAAAGQTVAVILC